MALGSSGMDDVPFLLTLFAGLDYPLRKLAVWFASGGPLEGRVTGQCAAGSPRFLRIGESEPESVDGTAMAAVLY